MATTVWGVVKDGLVVPSSSLPDGARVEIRLCDEVPVVSADLQAEFDAWDGASAQALALVERLAQEERFELLEVLRRSLEDVDQGRVRPMREAVERLDRER